MSHSGSPGPVWGVAGSGMPARPGAARRHQLRAPPDQSFVVLGRQCKMHICVVYFLLKHILRISLLSFEHAQSAIFEKL